MKKIKIGKPYIENSHNDKVRLCSNIERNGDESVLYYEVEREYRQFLNDDRCDAFVVGLINSCMFDGSDIVCDGVVTEQLLFQLNMYYIPLISDLFSDMNPIHILAKTTNESVKNQGAIGTGNSGGVDSTYTMLKYSKDELKSFKLTHVLFTNISTNDDDEDRIRRLFERDLPLKVEAAHYMGLIPISVYTNLYSFYKQPGIFNHYFAQQYCSAPLALGKLFKAYYFSSTFKANDFSMDENFIVSSGRYDIFSLKTLTTSNLAFYSAGTEVDRMDKLEYIVDSDYSKKYLQVCAVEQSAGGKNKAAKLNCGYCNKCGRMIGLFYAQGKLEDYKNIFDLSFFYENKAKFIAKNVEADQGAFSKEVVKMLKKNHKYPVGTSFFRPYYHIRYKLAKNDKLVKFYHKIRGIED